MERFEWVPTGQLRIVRRWMRADRLQQEYVAINLGPGGDRITEWRYVPVVKRNDT